MLKIILIGLAVIVGGFLIAAAFQAPTFLVTRSTTISAPPETIYAQVNDFHKWGAWNPWGKIDPEMKQTFEGATAGVGAVYTWTGNNEVGAGRMTITDSQPSELIRIKMEFIKPFAGTNTAEFSFKPQGDQTTVSWSMGGEKNFFAKVIGIFMDSDKMIGGQFEKGLADMKTVAEAAPK